MDIEEPQGVKEKLLDLIEQAKFHMRHINTLGMDHAKKVKSRLDSMHSLIEIALPDDDKRMQSKIKILDDELNTVKAELTAESLRLSLEKEKVSELKKSIEREETESSCLRKAIEGKDKVIEEILKKKDEAEDRLSRHLEWSKKSHKKAAKVINKLISSNLKLTKSNEKLSSLL